MPHNYKPYIGIKAGHNNSTTIADYYAITDGRSYSTFDSAKTALNAMTVDISTISTVYSVSQPYYTIFAWIEDTICGDFYKTVPYTVMINTETDDIMERPTSFENESISPLVLVPISSFNYNIESDDFGSEHLGGTFNYEDRLLTLNLSDIQDEIIANSSYYIPILVGIIIRGETYFDVSAFDLDVRIEYQNPSTSNWSSIPNLTFIGNMCNYSGSSSGNLNRVFDNVSAEQEYYYVADIYPSIKSILADNRNHNIKLKIKYYRDSIHIDTSELIFNLT